MLFFFQFYLNNLIFIKRLPWFCFNFRNLNFILFFLYFFYLQYLRTFLFFKFNFLSNFTIYLFNIINFTITLYRKIKYFLTCFLNKLLIFPQIRLHFCYFFVLTLNKPIIIQLNLLTVYILLFFISKQFPYIDNLLLIQVILIQFIYSLLLNINEFMLILSFILQFL